MKKTVIILCIGVVLIGIGIFIYLNSAYLNKSEVREIFLKDVAEYQDNIHIAKIELDKDEQLYEIEFYYFNQDTEYECKIDAKTGKIIYNNFKLNNSVEVNPTPNTHHQQNTNITLEEAKNIAVKDANIDMDAAVFTETKSDFEDGRRIYDIEFLFSNYKYSYEIDAATSEIIGYDKDIVG